MQQCKVEINHYCIMKLAKCPDISTVNVVAILLTMSVFSISEKFVNFNLLMQFSLLFLLTFWRDYHYSKIVAIKRRRRDQLFCSKFFCTWYTMQQACSIILAYHITTYYTKKRLRSIDFKQKLAKE